MDQPPIDHFEGLDLEAFGLPRDLDLDAALQDPAGLDPALRPGMCTLIAALTQQALVAGDVDAYLRWLAPDVLFEDSSAPPIRGAEHARRFLSEMLAAFEAAEFTRQSFHAYPRALVRPDQGPEVRVAMLFELTVTLVGGPTVNLAGVDLFEFDDALRITRMTSFYDPPGA